MTRQLTDYERDKEYEKSEWWRVPLVLSIVPALFFIGTVIIPIIVFLKTGKVPGWL